MKKIKMKKIKMNKIKIKENYEILKMSSIEDTLPIFNNLYYLRFQAEIIRYLRGIRYLRQEHWDLRQEFSHMDFLQSN